MSAFTPKAIVITAFPGKHGSISLSNNGHGGDFAIIDSSSVDFDDSDDSHSSSGGGPKKRRRLTHLSPDEKLLRRKLKNRVAAQTARDRKKALMAELEEKVSQLEEENKLLKRQNFSLKEASSSLAKENAALKSQLADQPLAIIKTDSESRSAAPAVPRQKEQVQILSRLMAQYFIFVVTISLMLSWVYYKNLQRTANASNRKRKQSHPSRRVSMEETAAQMTASEPTKEPLHVEWWGSHQRSWNPSTN